MKGDLDKIKKYYGEEMMHLTRDLFPSILENNGLLFSLIDRKFNRNRFLYEDIIKSNSKGLFQDFIYSLIDVKTSNQITDKTPFELLKTIGYNLYECKCSNDLKKFRKYFTLNEELCTFRDENRLKTDYVFFAIKDGADKLKRKDFINPKREDEYGSSVISIQFSKGKTNHLSIKNRYNHTVSNADATFNNNLENIIPGLTYSFQKYYNLNIQSNKDKFELDSYYQASDGKFYKYNMEINNIYYGPGNIIIDNGKVIDTYKDKSRYIFIDYFIIDMKEKKIFCYDKKIDDCFLDYYNEFKKVEIEKIKNGRNLTIYMGDKTIKIGLDKQNRIISLEDILIENINDGFLKYNKTLKELNLCNVKKIGDYFLCDNTDLTKINLEKVKEIHNDFLYKNNSLKNLVLNNLEFIGNNFMYNNNKLFYINISNVKNIGASFLKNNRTIKVLYLPNVLKIGDYFLYNNEILESFSAHHLIEVGNNFLNNNNALISLSLDKLRLIGKGFLKNNNSIKQLSLPNILEVGNDFLGENEVLNNIYVPNLMKIGRAFLFQNKCLENIGLFNVREIGNDCLFYNINLKNFIAPNLMKVGRDFLYWNDTLKTLYLNNLMETDRNFLHSNTVLEDFYAPLLEVVGGLSLQFNENLKNIEVSKYFEGGELFLDNHQKRDEIINSLKEGGNWCDKGYSLCKR